MRRSYRHLFSPFEDRPVDPDAVEDAALDAFGGLVSRSGLRLRTDSEAAQIASVRAGLGIGAMQAGVAARDPMLEPVLPDSVAWTLDAWLVLHDDLRKLPLVRLVADHLAAVLPILLGTGKMPSRRASQSDHEVSI